MLLASSTSLALADEIQKESDYDIGIVYGRDLGHCGFSIEFDNRDHLVQMRSCGFDSDLDHLVPNTIAILAVASHDGIRIGDYKMLFLGSLPAAWRQKAVDCYVAKFGLDDRRTEDMGKVPELLDTCGVFRELDDAFAKYGVRLRANATEKLDWFDLTNDRWKRDPAIRISMDGRHRHTGLVFHDAWFYFDITPLPVHT